MNEELYELRCKQLDAFDELLREHIKSLGRLLTEEEFNDLRRRYGIRFDPQLGDRRGPIAWEEKRLGRALTWQDLEGWFKEKYPNYPLHGLPEDGYI